MASLSIRDPSFRASLRLAAGNGELHADNDASEHADDIQDFMLRLRQILGGPPVDVEIECGLPPHTGFGSKTTTLLALGKAYATICNQQVSSAFLAALGRRAATSGGSANLINTGGFIIDGGHANPDDFARDPRRYLRPSRFAPPAKCPPVLVSLPFPPWPILIFIPKGVKIHGETEREWFHNLVPIPVDEARKTAHLIFMNMAPAIADADYAAFCDAVNQLTTDTCYKQAQIAMQHDNVKRLLTEVLARPDVDAAGMSVQGPACYIFTRQPQGIVDWLHRLKADGLVESYWFTCAQNHPAYVEGVPVLSAGGTGN